MTQSFAIAIVSGVLLCGSSLAQDTAPAAANSSAGQTQQTAATPAPGATPAMGNQPGPARIAPGVVIPVQLTKTVDAKKAKPGDEVFATVMQDLRTNDGEVIVARNTKVVGHVTGAQARTKEQKESELSIAFDHMVSKNGEMTMPMSIQAIIAPADDSSANSGGYGGTGPAASGTTATSPMAGRSPVSGPTQPQAGPLPARGSDAQRGGARPPITGKTQGVIGLPDVKLESNPDNASQGSVVSSDKNNVKLESGTLILLRVSE